MAKKVFISYSRNDYQKVLSIKETIDREVGIDCWMDLDGIESGEFQFTKAIVKAIDKSSIFLFMLSKSSQESIFALRELNYASKKVQIEKNRHVVIVNIDECQMTDEFEFMYSLTDTILWSDSLQRNKLLRDIKKWISLLGQDEINKEQSISGGTSQNPETGKEQNQEKKTNAFVSFMNNPKTRAILSFCSTLVLISFTFRFIIPNSCNVVKSFEEDETEFLESRNNEMDSINNVSDSLKNVSDSLKKELGGQIERSDSKHIDK